MENATQPTETKIETRSIRNNKVEYSDSVQQKPPDSTYIFVTRKLLDLVKQ